MGSTWKALTIGPTHPSYDHPALGFQTPGKAADAEDFSFFLKSRVVYTRVRVHPNNWNNKHLPNSEEANSGQPECSS